MLWYLSDQQNTVRDVAKYASTTAGSQATVRNHLEYEAYGNVTSVDDPSTGTASDGDIPGSCQEVALWSFRGLTMMQDELCALPEHPIDLVAIARSNPATEGMGHADLSARSVPGGRHAQSPVYRQRSINPTQPGHPRENDGE